MVNFFRDMMEQALIVTVAAWHNESEVDGLQLSALSTRRIETRFVRSYTRDS